MQINIKFDHRVQGALIAIALYALAAFMANGVDTDHATAMNAFRIVLMIISLIGGTIISVFVICTHLETVARQSNKD